MTLHCKFYVTTTQLLLAILLIYSPMSSFLINQAVQAESSVDRQSVSEPINHSLPAFTPPPSDPPVNAPGTGTR